MREGRGDQIILVAVDSRLPFDCWWVICVVDAARVRVFTVATYLLHSLGGRGDDTLLVVSESLPVCVVEHADFCFWRRSLCVVVRIIQVSSIYLKWLRVICKCGSIRKRRLFLSVIAYWNKCLKVLQSFNAWFETIL